MLVLLKAALTVQSMAVRMVSMKVALKAVSMVAMKGFEMAASLEHSTVDM